MKVKLTVTVTVDDKTFFPGTVSVPKRLAGKLLVEQRRIKGKKRD